MTILKTLESFLTREARVEAGDRILVAFSGGPDSTALLWAMTRVAPSLNVVVLAAHLDHGLDEDSARRAVAATRLCETIGVPLKTERREVASLAKPGESLEAASRRLRYDFLEASRRTSGARFTLTAHHADDQVETLLLRLTCGSGLAGLKGIAARRHRVLRPLLQHSRSDLLEVTREADLKPTTDPTNFELTATRNRLRHLVIPELLAEDPLVRERLGRIPKAVEGAQRRIEQFLECHLGLEILQGEVAVHRQQLAELPPDLLPFALGLIHRTAGLPYPPSRKARGDLQRQLHSANTIGCDCGGGWRWESEGASLRLCRSRPQPTAFAYTLQVPGECVIPEVGLRFRLEPGETAEWMFASSPRRTGLSLPIAAGDEVTIRNRRPGDRLRPLGCTYTRRLKDVLMDRRVPRRERDRLPLLFVDSRLAWVPGVTVNEDFKVGEGESVWVVQIDPL